MRGWSPPIPVILSNDVSLRQVSFWNICRVARSDPTTQTTSFLQLGVYVIFDLTTHSTTFIAVLRGKNPVVLPCWHSPRPADDPFGVLAPAFKSVVQSWASYFRIQDTVLSALVSHNSGWR